MNRKEMIIAIADEAGCSRRLVRKKLFELCVDIKKGTPTLLFYEAFLDKDTNWVRYDHYDWQTKNGFAVHALPSGIVVVFYNIGWVYDGDIWDADCYAKLWSRKH